MYHHDPDPVTVAHLRDIITRCGRNNVLSRVDDLWKITTQAGELVDSDTNFHDLFERAYNWEEDLPGFEGLLWWSPARCAGEVCLKGTRIFASTIAVTVQDGDDPKEHWDYISDEQIAAAVRYYKGKLN